MKRRSGQWLAGIALAAIVVWCDGSSPLARWIASGEDYQRVLNPHGRHFVFPHKREGDDGKIILCAAVVSILVSGTSYSVPSNWNNFNNSVECVAAGGSGSDQGTGSNGGGGGGGGGAYSLKNNISLTPGGSAAYQIGTGAGTTALPAGTAHTWFASNTTVRAAGGRTATGFTGAIGGPAADCVGDVTLDGGDGGAGNDDDGGGGGGGAAGPDGVGKNGGSGGVGGGGGGGSNGGTAGGTSGVGAGNGGSGNASSGAGGDGGANGAGHPGAVGGAGQNFQVSPARGSGGGGGGGGDAPTNNAGGNGGNYGGGGGGCGGGTSGGTVGVGADGLIVVTYTPGTAMPPAKSFLPRTMLVR